jgi:hypothetical protein
MPNRQAIPELRVEDFDFDLARKDNLTFATAQLQQAGAEIDAGAVDESAAFNAFAQNDQVLSDVDSSIAALHAATATNAVIIAGGRGRRPGRHLVGPFDGILALVDRYAAEISGSTAPRSKRLTDFANVNTIAGTPLIDLTYDNPPATSSGGGTSALPPNVGPGLTRPPAQNVPRPDYQQGPAQSTADGTAPAATGGS